VVSFLQNFLPERKLSLSLPRVPLALPTSSLLPRPPWKWLPYPKYQRHGPRYAGFSVSRYIRLLRCNSTLLSNLSLTPPVCTYVIHSGQIHATDPLMVHSRSAHGRGICSLYLNASVRDLNVTASMDNRTQSEYRSDYLHCTRTRLALQFQWDRMVSAGYL